MGIFSSILGKLGFGEDKVQAAAQAAQVAVAAPATAPVTTAAVSPPAEAPSGPAAISEVDVVGQLTMLAEAGDAKLNWKTSIVDLLKLIGLDSSLDARKTLAKELACPADKMADSAQMNMWLHKTVMQKLAANGGNIPAELK